MPYDYWEDDDTLVYEQEGEGDPLTTEEYAEMLGSTHRWAQMVLKKLEKQGHMRKVWVRSKRKDVGRGTSFIRVAYVPVEGNRW